MSRVTRRAQRHADRGGDPLDGLVNMFDLGIVLAVAFLLAALKSADLTELLTSKDVTIVRKTLSGQTVVIIGAGGIGQSAIQAARIAAAGRVVVIDANPAKEAVARRFASSSLTGVQKFEAVDYHQGALGLPILKDALAEFECTIVHSYPGGDHTIFVAQVEAADARGDVGREPLLYYRGRFDRLNDPEGKR